MTKLFSPGQIGGIEIRNRVVMPPMTTRFADEEGQVTDTTVAYFRARAAGGVGLVTVEMAAPEKVGRHRARELGIYDDRFLPGLKRLVEALHGCGARASIQLGHGGGHTRADICGEVPIAPSAVPHFVYEVTGEIIVPLEMSRARIERTTEAFLDAARRARRAGFDMVELHVAHGYLLSQFLCPAENRRTDEYGGSFENRARFGLDILRRIKADMPDFPVVFRISADDLFPGGMPFEDGLRLARWAEAAGADAIHVTAGHYRSQPSAEIMIPPMAYPDGLFLDYAARIKAAVSAPVIAVGRLGDPQVAKDAVDGGKADFVALGRPLLADPDWVAKVRGGQAIRRCIACNTCVNEMRGGQRLGCLVNPLAGREAERSGSGRPVGERICVVGSGPAGLSYASLMADGNRVTVLEREPHAGGAFRYAGKAPLFQEVAASQASLDRFIADLERDCRDKGVVFRYGVDVTRDPEALAGFDRVVFATGGRYRYGLSGPVRWVLDAGWGRLSLVRRLFGARAVRNWFYYRARVATGSRMAGLARPGQAVAVIGDAHRAGKSKEAIAHAFAAALSTAQDVRPGRRTAA